MCLVVECTGSRPWHFRPKLGHVRGGKPLAPGDEELQLNLHFGDAYDLDGLSQVSDAIVDDVVSHRAVVDA